jgi:hypothetical protein
MATLQTYITGANIPPILQERYGSALFIQWANEILSKMTNEHVLKEQKFERGLTVKSDVWVAVPSNYKTAIKVFDPVDSIRNYGFEEVEGKIKLTDAVVSEDEDAIELTVFSNYAVDHIDVAFDDDVAEDDYENYLLVITAGSFSGRTYLISGNDASVDGVARLYFLHELPSALSVTRVTAAELVSPEFFVMLRYAGAFEEITAIGDEVPINTTDERTIMSVGLRFMAERYRPIDMRAVQKWEEQYEKAIESAVDSATTGSFNPVQPRVLVGLIDDSSLNSDSDEETANEFWPL